jgi:hypothetical protein
MTGRVCALDYYNQFHDAPMELGSDCLRSGCYKHGAPMELLADAIGAFGLRRCQILFPAG